MKGTATQSCGCGMNEKYYASAHQFIMWATFSEEQNAKMFHINLLVACPARHLATLLIVLVYISRPRHWDTHNLPPNSRESGAGAGPGVATSLLLQPYSWIRVSVGVRPPSRRGEPRPASLWWLVMARWEAEWWWWVRCSAATNFDVYAAPSSETEVSPASNSFHSL